jgi:hypothetical protein
LPLPNAQAAQAVPTGSIWYWLAPMRSTCDELIDRKTWTGFDFLDAANELGAVAVLQRPFPRAALLRLVAEVLSDPAPSTAPTDEGDAELPGLAELLLRLENPNFA